MAAIASKVTIAMSEWRERGRGRGSEARGEGDSGMRQSGVRCKRNEPANEGVTRKEWEREARMRKRKRRKESTRHIHWFSVPSCRRFQRKYHGGRFEHGDEPSHGNYPLRKEGPPSFFCGISFPSSLRPRMLSSYASNWLPFRKFLSF